MPKILTALDALTVAAMDRADLLIIVGEKPVVPFLLPKRSTWSISLKPAGKGSPVFWQ